ncbi:caspase domain-containing protein [Amycolatopsis sp. MtRt-6]|uniref:caspase family protein n=1 Tax=Amycolatopsis sp. MtRt-6 TaxID=2792782 RepID=UPI001A8E4E84|nr:caspase family protein [Amycolatopsis sp. MtRt-6]
MIPAVLEESRVVLIGTSQYTDERLPPIPVVEQCLNDLRDVFTDPDHGLVQAEHCTVLLDEPDIAQLGRRIREAMTGATGLLVVYFVGHGIIGRRHELYLGLPDSDLEHPTFGSLSYDALRDQILDSPARTKVVILDSCYSGRAMGETLADPVGAVVGQLDIDGTYLMTSAQRDQVALVLDGEPHTAFTGRLLRVLKTGIPEAGEFLTVDDVYQHLSTMMAAAGLPRPQKRGSQNSGRFRIARNHAISAESEEDLDTRIAEIVRRGRAESWQKQLPDLEKILARQQAILGDRNVKVWRTEQLIAHAIGEGGDPAEASERLRKLHALQTAELGDEHADTLRSRHLLAVNLGEAGLREDAITLLRTLLPDLRRVSGHLDPACWRAQHVLAVNLALTGQTEESAALLKELLVMQKVHLGEDAPQTAWVRRDLTLLSREVMDV